MVGWVWLIRVCERANRADWGGKWLNRLDGFNRIFCRRFHHMITDPLPLPPSGGAVVVANHMSGLDPLLLIAASPRPLRFLIAKEEYERWWLRWLFRLLRLIPVERDRNPRRALYAAREALAAGEVVALFPQGRMHLNNEPVHFKRGAALLAAIAGVPIYPLRVEGVRGKGLTVGAVFLPSRAHIRAFAPVRCALDETGNCTRRLEDCLASPGEENPN